MFQHQAIDQLLLQPLLQQAGQPVATVDLQHVADEAVRQLRQRRLDAAAQVSWKRRLEAVLDQHLQTDAEEYHDADNLAEERRIAIIRTLHRFNRLVWAYPRFYALLKPLLRRIQQRYGRPARILELAGGSGEFAMAIAGLAKKDRMDVQVIGSDYFEGYVNAARQTAKDRGLDMEFQVINAFDMQSLPDRSVDVVFVAQSLHHFSPGQVALMIRQASRVAELGFVGIDGHRSALVWGAVPALGVLLGSRDFVHDAVISLRKFYTLSELELMARLAMPEAHIETKAAHPGYSVLQVLRQPGD